VKRKRLLDSYALLAYLNKEDGFEKVRNVLANAQKTVFPVLMNELNVGETYYILYRKRGMEQAEYFLDTVLAGLPISLISNDFNAVVSASIIKAQYPLSFADCFAVATAQRENAVILTGDPEFKNVEKFVKIDWLPKY
jgi:ribonuclease VapC